MALVVAIAVTVALATTPLVARLARSWGVVDRPGPLKTHERPVAYLGGAAVALGLVVGPLAAGRAELLVPLGLALALGITDDVRPITPGVRVAAEVAIAATAAAVVPGDAATRAVTAVLALGLLNAVNLLDGQDGLAAGVGLVSALGFAALRGDATPVGLALAGALAGFLVFNRPPARIYLGDGGAYLVGVALALLPALTRDASASWSVWIATPLLVALPGADTAIAILRRVRSHAPLFAGDRSHVYDQLVDRGFTIARSTAACVAVQVVCTTLGVAAARSGASTAAVITLLTLAGGALAVLGGGFLRATTTEGTT